MVKVVVRALTELNFANIAVVVGIVVRAPAEIGFAVVADVVLVVILVIVQITVPERVGIVCRNGTALTGLIIHRFFRTGSRRFERRVAYGSERIFVIAELTELKGIGIAL